MLYSLLLAHLNSLPGAVGIGHQPNITLFYNHVVRPLGLRVEWVCHPAVSYVPPMLTKLLVVCRFIDPFETAPCVRLGSRTCMVSLVVIVTLGVASSRGYLSIFSEWPTLILWRREQKRPRQG
jgi:hypothetical protein